MIKTFFKTLTIILFIVGTTIKVLAQETETSSEEITEFTESRYQYDVFENISVGFKLGINFPNMHYSDKDINYYNSKIHARMLFELYSEIVVLPKAILSIRPGIKFLKRGQHIEVYEFDYKINPKYTEFNLPIIYTFPQLKICKPYLLTGLTFGFASGGNVYFKDKVNFFDTETTFRREWDIKLSKANMKSFALGVHFGAGVKFNINTKTFPLILGAELNYHLGITNTYGDKELSQSAIALNVQEYRINGTRKNRGLEFGITAAVPLNGFKKMIPKKKPKPEPEQVIVVTSEPIIEPIEIIEISEKPCYTIEEMTQLIRENQNIIGKKICAIKQINFEFGKSVLTKSDKEYLSEIVNLMKQNEQINIKINGHTDNVGSEQVNMNLSRDRAKAVYNYLIQSGISDKRLSYEYFGFTRPIADNNTEEGRSINRRVEFEIMHQE